MDISFLGHACFKIKGKLATVIIDPFTPEMVGLTLPKNLTADIVLQTHDHGDHNNVAAVTGSDGLPAGRQVFSGPGEYEVKGVVITGVASFHDDKGGAERGQNTIYNVLMDGLNVVHLGDLGQSQLTESQVAAIGSVDVLLVPVGSVFTIDGKTAAQIVAQLEPRIIIPMHYATAGLKFELDPVEKFLKEMGLEHLEEQPKLSISKDKLPEEPLVVVLSKS